jgi:eukaryotic-like serine/threonine-protein kinase
MATASSRSLVGTVLSRRWHLLKKLGEGAMGEVYAAESTTGAGPRVAIKVLRAEFLDDPVVRSRFAAEGNTCARLIHPNIVRAIEYGTGEELPHLPYVVMELLEGVPLSAYTQNGGRVPVAQAVPIVQGVLSGLAAAHAQGIVHRDLKPDNVFLTRHPTGAFVVKVLDFGIAKVMEAAGGMGNRTRSGMLLGTAAYMSPEQVKNAGDVDQRADLWSVGVMLFEMLTGRVAFPAPTEYARLAAVITTEPEPLERVDPALAFLSPIVSRALRKNREARFASAIDMSRALAAVMPIDARGEGHSGVLSPAAALPLSRLPEVASVFEPSAAAMASALAHTAPAPGQSPGGSRHAGRHKPSGTLASAVEPSHPPEPPPAVSLLYQPVDGTLPSNDLPVLVGRASTFRRGTKPLVVLALIVAALLTGLGLGWALRAIEVTGKPPSPQAPAGP